MWNIILDHALKRVWKKIVEIVIVAVYVNDRLVFWNDEVMRTKLKVGLMTKFNMKFYFN